jgi:hypothetical protein
MVDFLYQSSSLKGLGHEMNVFEGIKIKEVRKVKFLLESLKYLLILKIVPKDPQNFCSGFPFLSLVNFSRCTSTCQSRLSEQFQDHGRISEQFSGSWADFGTTFRITGSFRNIFYGHRRLPESRKTSFLRSVTGGFLEVL